MEDELSCRTLPANFPHYPKSSGAPRETMSMLITSCKTIFLKKRAVKATDIMKDGDGEAVQPDLLKASECCSYCEQLNG